jgi:uncharacterized membrane protein YfcA
MDIENVIIVGIGVILFLMGGQQSYTGAHVSGFGLLWILGIVLVYLGLKLEQDKKKGKNK